MSDAPPRRPCVWTFWVVRVGDRLREREPVGCRRLLRTASAEAGEDFGLVDSKAPIPGASRAVAATTSSMRVSPLISIVQHRSNRIRIMPSANTKRSDFPGLAVVIIGASMLIAFAAMQMPPSHPAVAQDASSDADLAEHAATPTSNGSTAATPTPAASATATLSPTPTTSPTPEPPPPTDLDMKVVEDVAYVTFAPSRWTGSLQHFYLLEISRAVNHKDEFARYNSYIVQTSPASLTDLTAGWWYRARIQRCKTEHAVNCGHWSLPVYVHFPTIVKTRCGPALALGASQAVDLTPDDPLQYEKYPKLDGEWNEILVKYEAAIAEGLSPQTAFARANASWSVESAYDSYVISNPGSGFPYHRVLGWIRFVRPSDFARITPTRWLRDFLASQGISADVRDVFGDFHYDPEDVSGIDNIMMPLTLMGPLSELPEVRSLHLVLITPVFQE